jgi:hypothetical protein
VPDLNRKGEIMKYPEFYIKGSVGCLCNTTDHGDSVKAFLWAGKPIVWKSEAGAAKWLDYAKSLDPSAVIVDNTVIV